jgi:hypothetical protein
MTVSPATGKLIHHNDCSWCRHRWETTGKKPKGGRKPRTEEFCRLSDLRIPKPNSEGRRWCPQYQQENCPCADCTISQTGGLYT